MFFAFLADVRNDYDIKPLAKPKGLPEDVSDEVKEELDDSDYHSHSYFTLGDLEVANIFQKIETTGMVSNEVAKAYREEGTIPTSWCGYTNSEGYEQITWEDSLSLNIKDDINGIVEKLKAVANKYDLDDEDVRFVFAFDN